MDSTSRADSTSAAWTVKHNSASPQVLLGELVMAWAKDVKTGEPLYIFELGAARRGAASGCVCYSCGLPLVAVNAAKDSWKIRPHFRHPDGAERSACLVLTARAAVLEMLRSEEYLTLPSRRVGAPVVGSSGKRYDAWVTKPAERVALRSFQPQDHVSAILTLEDGRELLVKLTGSLETVQDGNALPVIQIEVSSPELASMSPELLKSKLRLLVEGGSWCGTHWDDAAMRRAAEEQAQRLAEDALDWASPVAVAELGDAAPRESLLHWLAKEILREERRIRVPELQFHRRLAYEKGVAHGAPEFITRQAAMLELSDVRLEKRVGQIRPDVVATYRDPTDGLTGVLLIEVTVANQISPERALRIEQEGMAALEINLSELGGTVNRDDFSRLLIDELVAKRWLFHPWVGEQAKAYDEYVLQFLRNRQQALERLRTEFLAVVEHHCKLRTEVPESSEESLESKQALEAARELSKEFSKQGISGADDRELFGFQGCVLDRLLSIRHNRVVGYRVQTLWQVLNAILCDKEPYSLKWHTLYLTALKVFDPPLKLEHRKRVDSWRTHVLKSLVNGETIFQRDRRLDEVLGFLFPEMADALRRPLPTPKVTSTGSVGRPVETGGKSSGSSKVGQGVRSSGGGQRRRDYWLQGEELAEWKRRYPESAKAWEGHMPECGSHFFDEPNKNQ